MIDKYGNGCSQKINVKYENDKLKFELIYVPS